MVLAALASIPLQAQTWQAVPLRTSAQASQGIGGEGGQWPQALAIDATGNFLLFGTDVGGLYRSLDGGANWEPCNVGYHPRGASAVAIDPANANHVIAIGANAPSSDLHGIYRSTDRGASWARPAGSFQTTYSGYRDVREQVAFTPNTLLGGNSRYVFWSAPDGRLYWSQDGGVNWAQRNTGFGNGIIKIHTGNGTVYVGTATGLHRSTNLGSTFANRLSGAVQGLDAVGNSVWVSKVGGVWRSLDSATSFTKLAGAGLPANIPLRNLAVSRANTGRMLVVGDHGEWDKRIYRSVDGGATWSAAGNDSSGSFIPYNSRLQLFAWHPTNSSVVHSFGGDYITRSTDAGAIFRWHSSGYNGIAANFFTFNVHSPNVLFVPARDYSGATSTDGGNSWTYEAPGGQPWGGHVYGAGASRFADTGETIFWGGDDSDDNGVRVLRIRRGVTGAWSDAASSSGGQVQWNVATSASHDIAYVDPAMPWVLFAAHHRSIDRGWSWTPMSGVNGVITHSAATNALFGTRTSGTTHNVVTSVDQGGTWSVVGGALSGIPIADVAVGTRPGGGQRIWVAHADNLKYWDPGVSTAWTTVDAGLRRDQWNAHRVRTVATDPTNLAIVYAGSARDVYSTRSAVQRSVDHGVTWTTLTLSAPLAAGQKDGGREAVHIRVHPTTRQAWVATSCYGLWKINGP